MRGGPDSYDFVITFKTTGDRLVLERRAEPIQAGTTTVTLRFADGTVWNRAAMLQRAVADADGTGNDNVYGFETVDDFAAKAATTRWPAATAPTIIASRGAAARTRSRYYRGLDRVRRTVRFVDFASTDAEVSRDSTAAATRW